MLGIKDRTQVLGENLNYHTHSVMCKGFGSYTSVLMIRMNPHRIQIQITATLCFSKEKQLQIPKPMNMVLRIHVILSLILIEPMSPLTAF